MSLSDEPIIGIVITDRWYPYTNIEHRIYIYVQLGITITKTTL